MGLSYIERNYSYPCILCTCLLILLNRLGVGVFLNPISFSLAWPSEWWSSQNITFLELVPIILAAEVWGDMFRNASVLLHTDNLALVYVINKQSSKEPW